MGITKPLLPAPTDLSDDDSGGNVTTEDIATNVSRRTDQSHYSIPNDGRPITFPLKKITTGKKGHARSPSQTSLLIEFFEASKGGKDLRVKVTPSSALNKEATKSKGPAPVFSKRVPLNQAPGEEVDFEVGQHEPGPDNDYNQSEISTFSNARYAFADSDVSSMPPESMIDAPVIAPPQAPSTPSIKDEKDASRNVSRDVSQNASDISAVSPAPLSVASDSKDRLKTPAKTDRERSTERITQKVMEKLAQDREKAHASRKSRHSRNPSEKTEFTEATTKSRSRRSSNASGAESSLLRARGVDSNVSDGSKVSLNNPRLLATVEDVVRRLILPEIETIKRHQSIRETVSSRDRDSKRRDSRDSYGSSELSQTDLDRRLSKSSSAPHIRAKISRKKDSSDKHRRSSGGRSDDSGSRRESLDSIDREKERIRKSAKSGLTTAALQSHDSDSYEANAYERKRLRNKSKSRGTSLAYTDNESMPRLPMASAIGDSELTRDSLLSAETNDSEVAEIRRSKEPATPVKEVMRGLPKTVRPVGSREGTNVKPAEPTTPRESRSKSDLKLASPKSDQSLSTRTKGMASLGAAGAALYGLHRLNESPRQSPSPRSARSREQSVQKDTTPDRRKFSFEASPEQSPAASDKALDPVNASPQLARDNVEEDVQDEQDDSFFDNQRKLNDEYRSSIDSERDIDAAELQKLKNIGHTRDMSFAGKAAAGQNLKEVLGANPDFTYSSPQVESHVASLLEPSMVGSNSDHAEADADADAEGQQSRDLGIPKVEAAAQSDKSAYADKTFESVHELEHRTSSEERWKMIRGHAQQLSRGSPGTDKADEAQVGTSGMPNQDSPMPELGYGDAESLTTNQSLKERQSSVLEEPLGDVYENRGHWPYEPTPPQSRQLGAAAHNDTDEQYLSAGNAALMGAAAGAAGLGIASGLNQHPTGKTTERKVTPQNQQPPQSSRPAFSPAGPRAMSKSYEDQRDTYVETPAHLKDEGYISAANAKSPGDISPLSFSKPPPRLFDDPAQQPKQDSYERLQKRQQYLSGNSHGMSSPLYDAATGRGINNIQSKDVVALMDHLTVRDGQRNARDTEILVTLVRSAAEMRNSFEEMKKLVEHQNTMNLQQADTTAERAVNKALMSGARGPQLKTSRSNSADQADEPAPKKGNIFQRAIRGLSGRSTNDLSKIEDMLMHLLDEMEDIKLAQSSLFAPPTISVQNVDQPDSMDSYERLRAAPESGYEPSGHAGTSNSTPTRSAQHLGLGQTPPSNQSQRMHSGYGAGRNSNKISTVIEDDEEFFAPSQHASQSRSQEEMDAVYPDEDGMLTPTQEAQHHRDRAYAKMTGAGEDITPTKQSDKSARFKSGGSTSMFGSMPKVSRWSKTTASSVPAERMSYENENNMGPPSEASRSGSAINVIPPTGEPYAVADDDRLRSMNSLASDAYSRTPSPLVPGERPMSMDDPKYQANRHSLTLEHPQPRQGNTERHQRQLESQAHGYRTSTGQIIPGRPHSKSPDGADVYGSNESLSKHRFANTRPQRAHDTGPLIPPKDNPSHTAPSPVQSDDYTPTSSAHSYRSDADSLKYPAHDGEEAYDPAEPDTAHSKEYWSGDWSAPDPSIPLARKRSPYSPGGLLAPIAERYSLEQARSEYAGSPSKARHARESSRTQSIMEEDEESERAATPVGMPQKAVGAENLSPGGVRKLTGPRDMPGGKGSPRSINSASKTEQAANTPEKPSPLSVQKGVGRGQMESPSPLSVSVQKGVAKGQVDSPSGAGSEGWTGRGTVRRKPAPGGYGY